MPSPPTSSILITGANRGLGAGIVSQFLDSPHATTAHAIYCVRNISSAARLQQLLSTAAREPPLSHDILALDLSSLAAVRATAESINARVRTGALPPLRAVVLNAATQHTRSAVAFTPYEGIEANLAVNYLANVLLVLLLLPSLWRGDEGGEGARVVVVSSWAHDADDWKNRKFITSQRFKGRNVELDLDALAAGATSLAGGSSWAYGKRRYGVSKLLLIMFMFSLQRRLLANGSTSRIRIFAVDPGWMPDTDLARESSTWIQVFYRYILHPIAAVCVRIWPNGLLRTTAKSGGDMLWAALARDALAEVGSNEEGKDKGPIYLNGRQMGMPAERARDKKDQEWVWEQTLRMLGLEEKDVIV